MVGLSDGGLVGLQDDLGSVVVDVEGPQDGDETEDGEPYYFKFGLYELEEEEEIEEETE